VPRKTILLVDDDEVTRRTLASRLQARFDLLIAVDGLDAAYLYEEHLDRIAAIVTDLNTSRLDGRVLTEWVHHIQPRLPVIVTGGGINRSESKELSRLPMTGFLRKPFRFSQLEKLLNAFGLETPPVCGSIQRKRA